MERRATRIHSLGLVPNDARSARGRAFLLTVSEAAIPGESRHTPLLTWTLTALRRSARGHSEPTCTRERIRVFFFAYDARATVDGYLAAISLPANDRRRTIEFSTYFRDKCTHGALGTHSVQYIIHNIYIIRVEEIRWWKEKRKTDTKDRSSWIRFVVPWKGHEWTLTFMFEALLNQRFRSYDYIPQGMTK